MVPLGIIGACMHIYDEHAPKLVWTLRLYHRRISQ
ncbi:unnamed protein product [Tenebrio molitor]|nr:unnamed protein product [Tenebrio molitor]